MTARAFRGTVALCVVLVTAVVLLTSFAPSSVAQVGNAWRTWNQHATETSNQVAVNGFSDTSAVVVAGRNDDVDTGTDEDVWIVGGDYVFPPTAQTLTLVSDSAADDGSPAGTGGHTVRVDGLDADYNPLTEFVTMDGTTPVITVGEFLRVNKGTVREVGTAEANVGTITATQTTSALTMFTVPPSFGQSSLGVYTVAADHELVATRIWATIGKQAATSASIAFIIREFGLSFRAIGFAGLHSQGTTLADVSLPVVPPVPGRADLKIRVSVSANNTDVNGGFEGFLIDRR